MLQQTVVSHAANRYIKWLERFPTIAALANATEQEVLAAWEGLGYYGRARNLFRAAKVMVDQHGGSVPDDYDSLRALPGLGHYTAAAIMALAYGKPVPAVDANVRRIVGRLQGGDAEGHWQNETARAYLGEALKHSEPKVLTEAIMELGQTVCTPRRPACADRCPLHDYCLARIYGRQEEQPPRRRKDVIKSSRIALVIICSEKLLVRVGAGPLFGGVWLLPTFDLQHDPAEFIKKWMKDRALEMISMKSLAQTVHNYTNNLVKLKPYLIEANGRTQPTPAGYDWIDLSRISDFPFPSAHRRIITRTDYGVQSPGGPKKDKSRDSAL